MYLLDDDLTGYYGTHMATRTWNEAVAAEIRAEQARQQISNRRLATLAGLEQSNVARKVRAARDITVDEFAAMSTALGVAPVEMLARAARSVTGVSASVALVASPSASGNAASPSSVERLLEHEQACDSCWSLEDAARHTAGAADETDPAVRPAALAAATGQEVA